MSGERIDCPVPWCEGEARGHRPRNEHDFHMGADVAGPLHIKAGLIQTDDGPTQLVVDAEAWELEATVEDLRRLAGEASAAAVWLREQADQLAAHNEARSQAVRPNGDHHGR